VNVTISGGYDKIPNVLYKIVDVPIPISLYSPSILGKYWLIEFPQIEIPK
jgi:hypothetical protein